MKRTKPNTPGRYEKGQSLPMLALLMVVIILFIGLAIDFGFAYVTKASLSKAVDAACLVGIRNLSQGRTQAAAIARNSFNVNYGTPGRDYAPPVVNIVFSTDSFNNTLLTVDATARINTFFIRILPQYATLNVASHAQATRSKLVMSLVLDNSGSMADNGGSRALKSAVPDFIKMFDPINDRVAMVEFQSIDKVDVPLQDDFVDPIESAVRRMSPVGATFAHGGLVDAQNENNKVPVNSGENVIRVVVFFTDGIANTVQDTLSCNPAKKYNYGGYDTGNGVAFINPRSANLDCSVDGNNPNDLPSCCRGTSKFLSQETGRLRPFNRNLVTREAEYRSLALADSMRTTDQTIVYAIGLGRNINEPFLLKLANDKDSSTFNPSLPEGMALFARDCPSATCDQELDQIFKTIASNILLRLTQ